jgi:putative ABC transport system substrate-binding protein
MRRRDLIFFLGGAAIMWPLGAGAQQKAMPLVGVLDPTSLQQQATHLAMIREELAALGYVDGRNVAFEYRFAEGQNDRLPALAAELVSRDVDVIITGSIPAIRAAMKATVAIPIVFVAGVDPISAGLVSDLTRPDRNLTGFTVFGPRMNAKRLEVLCTLVPNARVVGYMTNPTNPAAPKTVEQIGGNAYETARGRGVQLHLLFASTEPEIDVIFASLADLKADGLVISVDPIWSHHRAQIVGLAARYQIPTIYYLRHYVEAGGLISYAPREDEAIRSVGVYTGRILAGAKVADLPIQMPTRYEMVINRKAANSLGLTIPLGLETQADEILE